MKQKLTTLEASQIKTGEVTLTAVFAICAIAIVAVIVYKLFVSKEGGTTAPGGWKFNWK